MSKGLRLKAQGSKPLPQIFGFPHSAFRFLIFSLFGFWLFALLSCGYPKKLPEPVILVEPKDADSIGDNWVSFVWRKGEFSLFHLEISQDRKFADCLFSDSSLSDSSATQYLPDGLYYYRVRGKTEEIWGEWSESRSFCVGTIELVSEFSLIGYPNSLGIFKSRDRSFALVAEGQAGLAVVEITNPREPRRVTGYSDNENNLCGVGVGEENAYLAYGKKELVILSLSLLPDSVVLVGSNEYSVAYGYDLVVDEEREMVYCAAREQFITFDISDPQNPFDYKKENFPSVRGIEKSGDFLYLACEQLGVFVYQATDSFPIRLSHLDTPYNARDVWCLDTILFVADGRALILVSVADKRNPKILTEIPVKGYAQKITGDKERKLLSLSSGDGGLYLYDLSSLPPRLKGAFSLPYVRCSYLSNNLLLVGERDRGLLIYEVK